MIKELIGHQDRINRAEFSHDSKILASASADHTTMLWDTQSGELLAALRGHQDSVYRVKFHADNTVIATAGADDRIMLWKQVEGRWTTSATLSGHQNEILDLDFSPDQKLASASADGTVRLWRLANPSIKPLPHRNSVSDIGFGSGGRLGGEFVVSGGRKNIRFWDAAQGSQIGEIEKAHDGEILSVSLSPDQNRLASVGDDGEVKLWELSRQDGALKGKKIIPQFIQSERSNSAISAITFSPDGQLLAMAGSTAGKVFVELRNRDNVPTKLLLGHSGEVTSVSFSQDSQFLVSGSKEISRDKPNGEIILWTKEGKLLARYEEFQGESLGDILSVAVSPDGQFVAAAGSKDNTIKLWRLIKTGKTPHLEPFKILEGHTAPVLRIAYSPDSQRLASASQDGTVKLWTENGLITTFKQHHREVSSVKFSQDGKQLASASYDGYAFLYNLPDDFENVEDLVDQGCTLSKDYRAALSNSESIQSRETLTNLEDICR